MRDAKFPSSAEEQETVGILVMLWKLLYDYTHPWDALHMGCTPYAVVLFCTDLSHSSVKSVFFISLLLGFVVDFGHSCFQDAIENLAVLTRGAFPSLGAGA